MRLPGTVTTEDVARTFHVTDRTVRRWAAEGTIPGRLRGRRWEFDADEVAAAVVAADDTEEERP